jgi:serine protease Do
MPPAATIQTALSAPRPLIVRGVTRALARRGLAAIEAIGSKGYTEAEADAARRSRGRAGLVAAGAAALAAAGWLAFHAGWGSRATAPGALPASPEPGAATALTAPPHGREPLPTRDIAERLMPAAVSVRCSRSVGSGFFVTEDLVLTNAHVLCPEGENPRVAFSDGRSMTGVAVRSDEALDLAVLSVTGMGARPMPLGDAGHLEVGDRVVMIGSPMGLDFTVHEGTVSSFRELLGVSYIQIDAKVNPGNSGGPLVDDEGRVVGIVSLKHASAEGIGFAIPVNYAFTGAAPLVSPPDGLASSPEFERRLVAAQDAERKTIGEIAQVEFRPALAGAALDQFQNLVAKVVQPAAHEPAPRDVTFNLWKQQKKVCTLKATIVQWKELERREAPSNLDSRALSWLENNGLTSRLYLGEATLNWNACSRSDLVSGVELEMEGADEAAARLRLD